MNCDDLTVGKDLVKAKRGILKALLKGKMLATSPIAIEPEFLKTFANSNVGADKETLGAAMNSLEHSHKVVVQQASGQGRTSSLLPREGKNLLVRLALQLAEEQGGQKVSVQEIASLTGVPEPDIKSIVSSVIQFTGRSNDNTVVIELIGDDLEFSRV